VVDFNYVSLINLVLTQNDVVISAACVSKFWSFQRFWSFSTSTNYGPTGLLAHWDIQNGSHRHLEFWRKDVFGHGI